MFMIHDPGKERIPLLNIISKILGKNSAMYQSLSHDVLGQEKKDIVITSFIMANGGG